MSLWMKILLCQEDELLKLVDEVIENVEIHEEANTSTISTPIVQLEGENGDNSDSQSSEEMHT